MTKRPAGQQVAGLDYQIAWYILALERNQIDRQRWSLCINGRLEAGQAIKKIKKIKRKKKTSEKKKSRKRKRAGKKNIGKKFEQSQTGVLEWP